MGTFLVLENLVEQEGYTSNSPTVLCLWNSCFNKTFQMEGIPLPDGSFHDLNPDDVLNSNVTQVSIMIWIPSSW